MGNTSHSLKALETCLQPSSLSLGVTWEYWLDDTQGLSETCLSWSVVFFCPPPTPRATEFIIFRVYFPELLALWRNNSFTFMSYKSGPATISQVFLRVGLKSEAVILPVVFILSQAGQRLSNPCSDPRSTQCLHFSGRTGLWSVPMLGAPGTLHYTQHFLLC